MFFNINFKLKYAGESINIDDEILENVDTDKFGKKKNKHYIRYRTKNIYNTFSIEVKKVKRSYIIIGYSKVDKGYKGATKCL
jgi:hypothetical protein